MECSGVVPFPIIGFCFCICKIVVACYDVLPSQKTMLYLSVFLTFYTKLVNISVCVCI